MGNEISWPCTDRKAQERKVRESKFDMSYWEEYDENEAPKQNIPNMMKVEAILNQQNEYIRYEKAVEKSPSTTKSSPRDKLENQEFYETAGLSDKFPPILLTSRALEPFDALIRDIEKIYDSQMVPITICPNPLLPESLTVMQTLDRYNRIRMMGMNKFKIQCFKPKLRTSANSDLYQEIIKFITAKYNDGYIYIGCFANKNQGVDPPFSFVYLQQQEDEEESPVLKSKLEFETVAEPTAKDIEQILVERGKMDSIFRENSIRQVMIFEKGEESRSYHVAEIQKEDLAAGILEKRISKNISDYCEINKFDFAGIVVNYEKESAILILVA